MAAFEIPIITREYVKDLCGGTIYGRGLVYFQAGMIRSATIEGDTLVGEVSGTRPQPYNVKVRLTEDEVLPRCDCPHDSPFCKHVCAVLLAWAESPGSFTRVVKEDEFEGGQSAAMKLDGDLDTAPIGAAALFDRDKARKELAQMLQWHTLDELRRIARSLSLSMGNKTKDEAVAHLANLLTDPAQIRDRLLSLGKEERLLLDLVHLLGSTEGLKLDLIEKRLNAMGLHTLASRAASVVQELFNQGLLVSSGYGRWNSYYPFKVPDAVNAELFAHSISYMLKPSRYKEETLEVVAQPQLLDEDLHLVWSYLAQSSVVPIPIPKRSLFEEQREGLRGWNNAPSEIAELERQPKLLNTLGHSLAIMPPPETLPEAQVQILAGKVGGGREEVLFLYQMLKKLSLVEEKARIVVNEDKMQQFLRLPRAERLRTLVAAWLKLDRWCEAFLHTFSGNNLQVRRFVGSAYLKRREFLRDLTGSQDFVVNTVARLEENSWYSCRALADALYALKPDFLVQPKANAWDRPSWWVQSTSAGKTLDPYSRDDWMQVEGQFIAGLLQGPLLWFGAVHLAYADGKLEAFRTTPLTPILSGRPPGALEAPDEGTVEIGGDLSITVAPGAADSGVHSFLTRLGVLAEATPTRFRYRLTETRVARAFEEGLGVEDIIGSLHGYGVPADPGIVEALRKWWESYGLIRLYDHLTVVEFADDYVLKELRATTSIGDHIIYELSPRFVVVSPDSVEKLVAEMTRKGHTPRVVDGGAE
ncbi:MAG: SWIM zinc finger family protein [Chloroflexi bacterium]|nr:SWIM zinc finger family protein [Chloroflexota bacterium]